MVGLISRKRWKIVMLLLQAINTKWYMAYRIAPFPMTLSDVQGHSHWNLFSSATYRTVVQQLNWQDFECHRESRGSSAIVVPLVLGSVLSSYRMQTDISNLVCWLIMATWPVVAQARQIIPAGWVQVGSRDYFYFLISGNVLETVQDKHIVTMVPWGNVWAQ